MPDVLIAPPPSALPAEAAITDRIQQAFSDHLPDLTPIATDPVETAHQLSSAGALLVVIGPDWLERITQAENEYIYDAIASGLHHEHLLVQVVLIADGVIPEVMDLPEDLRALPYLRAASVKDDDSLPRAVRQIAVPVAHHLKRLESARAIRSEGRVRQGLPWNLVIILTAVITGIVFIIIPDLRGADDDTAEATVAPPPMSAAANAAIINPQDGVMIGVGAGFGGTAPTDDGEVVPRGEAVLNGVLMALADRPEVRVDGVRFPTDTLSQDAGCSSEGGIQTAETFTTDPISLVGVIGHQCNVSCFPARSIYDEANITTVSPGCDAPGLTLEDNYSFNRVVPSQADGAREAARVVQATLGVSRAFVIGDENVTGAQLAEAFAGAFEDAGGEVVAQASISSRTLDAAALAAEIEASGADVVFYGGRAGAAALVATEIAGVGEIPLVLSDNIDLEAFVGVAGDAAEGAYTYRIVPPDDNPLRERYINAFEAEPPSAVYAYAYDATNMLLDAIEAVGTVDVVGNLLVDRDALQAYIRAYQGEGVTGSLTCDGSGDCGAAIITLLTINDGVVNPVAGG